MVERIKMKSFAEGILVGIGAHAGGWLVLATVDKLFYMLGHVIVVVGLDLFGRR